MLNAQWPLGYVQIKFSMSKSERFKSLKGNERHRFFGQKFGNREISPKMFCFTSFNQELKYMTIRSIHVYYLNMMKLDAILFLWICDLHHSSSINGVASVSSPQIFPRSHGLVSSLTASPQISISHHTNFFQN